MAAELATPRQTNDAKDGARKPGFRETLKKQFRELMKKLTHHSPAPAPRTSRRRGGETAAAFRVAAKRTLRPVLRLPAVSRAVGFIEHTLVWFHLWEWRENPETDDTFEAQGNSEQDHLSPRL
jgi:hypothetical protein